MDDLSSLNWASKAQNNQNPAAPTPSFNNIRSTPPVSGRSTPLSQTRPPSKPSTPANDSFSGLVSFSSANPSAKNLSLQDQQRRLAELKAQQEATKRKQQETQYGGGDGSFWENLGSGRNTPAPQQEIRSSSNGTWGGIGMNSQKQGTPLNDTSDDDFLANFSADAPVDSSTNFPKPSGLSPDLSQEALERSRATFDTFTKADQFPQEDDDPFGLSELNVESSTKQNPAFTREDDNDDVLGLLGKPVSTFSKPKPEPSLSQESQEMTLENEHHPQDRAVAELVDMGFTPDKARRALESTESGLDVQAAVGWLLNQAHLDSREKSRGRGRTSGPTLSPTNSEAVSNSGSRGKHSEAGPAWMRAGKRAESATIRSEGRSSSNSEKDSSQIAPDFGATFVKTAGSLWKAGSKKVQKAVQDFNSDSDSNQPRWLRENAPEAPLSSAKNAAHRRRRSSGSKQSSPQVTDEAMLLETDAGRPAPRKPPRLNQSSKVPPGVATSRDHSPALPSRLREEAVPTPAFLRQQQALPPRTEAKASLSRQAIEDAASQAYVSSARRRPKPSPASTSLSAESDLLETAQASKAVPSRPAPATQRPLKSSPPITSRPPAPKRTIPPLDPSLLSTSHKHRLEGSAHFKRGDYSAAQTSYAAALRPLPPTHPITIILLTNRALTSLKVGEPKQAISDSDAAIAIIGPSQGTSESIDLQNGEAPKPMREYQGKALMRKAEALEQMERWKDAAAIWREAVSSGHGGATAIKGRERCEKAAAPAPPPRPSSAPARRPAVAATKRPPVSTVTSDAAVSRLRAANAAAERADDEKFALADSVEAKITAWRGGKADNLRALLSSLDMVLWPEAGWKKIGMSELVLPNKVKVQYMKGIAKVHPDKVGVNRLWMGA